MAIIASYPIEVFASDIPRPVLKQTVLPVIDSAAVGKYLAADYAFRGHDTNMSARYYIKALEKDPENLFILQNTYKLLLLAGRVDEAIYYAGSYLQQDPFSVSANLIQSIGHIKESEFDEADQLFSAISSEAINQTLSGVDKITIPFLKLWIALGQRDEKRALLLLDEIKHNKNIPAFLKAYQGAMAYDFIGNFNKAETLYVQTVALDATPYHLVKAAGNFFERYEQPERAKRLYLRYQQRYAGQSYFSEDLQRIADDQSAGMFISSPSDGVVETLMEAARILFKNTLYTEALAYLRLTLFLDPDNEHATILLGAYFEEHGMWEQAAEIYKNIDKDSDFYEASRISMAENLYLNEQKDEAKSLLLAVAKDNQENDAALLILGDLLRKDKAYAEAAEIYTLIIDSIKNVENYHWPIFFARAVSYEQSDNWEKAEKDLLKALNLNPNQPEALNYLGYSWIDRGMHSERASKMIEIAVQERPNDPQIIDSMGWVYYQQGEYEKAASYLEKALTLLPYDPVLNDHLGDIYWRLGRKLEAGFQWQRALEHSDGELGLEQIEHKIRHGL